MVRIGMKERFEGITSKILNRRTVSIATVLLMLFSVANIPDKSIQLNTKSVAVASEGPQVRNVNLGTVGINNPSTVSSVGSNWSNGTGSYVYYGSYYDNDVIQKEPLKWRVLSTNNDSTGNTSGMPNSLLLLTDSIVDNVDYNESFTLVEDEYRKNEGGATTSYKANDYLYSNVKYWLNSTKINNAYAYEDNEGNNYTSGGFYDNAFTVYEKNAINATSKQEEVKGDITNYALTNDKVFLLSNSELHNPLYGFYVNENTTDYNASRRLNYTTYVKNRYGLSGFAAWQLRSTKSDKSDVVQYIYEGKINDARIDNKYSGVVPAINLNKTDIAYIASTGYDKTSKLSTTTTGSHIREWVVALQSATGFEAGLAKGALGIVKPGAKLKVSVNKLPSDVEQFNQISAMLVDNNGTVSAYGRVSSSVATGEFSINIPYDINDGNYTLKLFAEDVNSTNSSYMTDYVSNIVNVSISIDSKNVNVQEKLAEEKLLKHDLTAVLYDTADYAAGGAGKELTYEGITVDKWQYETSKYLQIDVEMHNSAEEDHTVRIELPKEMYFIGDLTELPAGCSDVKFTPNEDLLINGDAKKYNVNNKSGVLTYYLEPNLSATTIQLEVRYDYQLWDKMANSSIADVDTVPIDVSINYEAEKGQYLEGGELKSVRVKKITANSGIGRSGYGVYTTSGIDLSKENAKAFTMNVIDEKQVTYSNYFKDAIFEIRLPYWQDSKGVKHYLKYDINRMTIYPSFFTGAANYEIIEQSDAVIKISVKNMMYNTQVTMFKMFLVYPDDIVTEKDYLTFSNGKYIINATSNNGNSVVPLNYTIPAVEYATKYTERITIGGAHRTAHYNPAKTGVTHFGGIYFENKGIAPSSPKTITYTFPKELLVTTINLPTDSESQKIALKYKLYDENSKEVYLNKYNEPCNATDADAKDTWTVDITNTRYKKAADNMCISFNRSLLPTAHQRYYIREVSYTIQTIHAGRRLYAYASQHSLGGCGNYFGYFGNGAKVGSNYITKVNVKSSAESKIADTNTNLTTYVRDNYTVAYGIDSVKFSSGEIKAGEALTVSGSMFATSYPYGNSSKINGLRIALVLSKHVEVNKDDVVLTLSNKKTVKVENVTCTDIGNNQNVWIIEADKDVYIGYLKENLGVIANGDRLNFSVPLKTSKRMEYTSLFTNNMLYCTGKGCKNAAGGSYNWASSKDVHDINGNGSTTDAIGCSRYTSYATCNIVPSPPSLDIEDSLSIESPAGKGKMEKGVASIGDKDDVVTYSLNIKCVDDGRASDFKYYIPIPNTSTARDNYFMLSDKDSSFDMQLLGPAGQTGNDIYYVKYCFVKGLSYDEAHNLDESKWYESRDGQFYDSNGKKQNKLKWQEVTMVRLSVSGFIEKGIDSTVNLHLKYAGNNFSLDAGKKTLWRSSGYYVFDTGVRVLSGHFKSPGCAAQIKFFWSYTDRLTYIATANKSASQTNVVHNRYLNNLPADQFAHVIESQKETQLKITDIGLSNVELKSKSFMVNNQNTLTAAEADKYLAFEIRLENGKTIDLNDGIGQDVCKLKEFYPNINWDNNGNHYGQLKNSTPKIDMYMYYGSKFSNVALQRQVTVTLSSDTGVEINLIADIVFVSKNNIDILNGEESTFRGSDLITNVFYAYEMDNRQIVGKKDVEFRIDKTNDIVNIEFAVSTSRTASANKYYVSQDYMKIYDSKGVEVKRDKKKQTYRLEGGVPYYIAFTDDYYAVLGDDREKFKNPLEQADWTSEDWAENPWYEYTNTGGTASQFIYLHAMVPSLTTTEEVLLVKRRLFGLN